MVRRDGWLGPGIFALALACGADPTGNEPVPEPTEALRPPELRGEVHDDARVADYEIEAKLDGEEHRIDGKLRLRWRNATARSVDRLPFHLYMNAFRAEDTTWMRESRGSHRGVERDEEHWGYVDVKKVDLLARGETPSLEALELPGESRTPLVFAEDADPTTMTVQLPQPLGPGESVVLELEFTTQLPQVFARTGFHEDFHLAGQWFPKIGVLEEEAGWQAHTFTLNGEFYADFGNYRVALDVPEEMIVGASGIRTAERVEDGRKHLVYEAQMVHDFAWTASPHFIEHWGEHEGIRIRQLIQPDHAAEAELHLEAQKATLDSMQARFGPYPWSTITIVHPPEGAEGAGGMEYPTFYTTSDVWSGGRQLPTWVIEERVSGLFTTIHEFGHQYFQGLLASNEQAQPWLDEGLNTMSNALTLMDWHDDQDPWLARVFGHALHESDLGSLSLMSASLVDPVDQSASDFHDLAGAYGAITYQKTSALMLTLRNVAGHERFDEAMRAYADAWRFRHPTGADLERVLTTELGERVLLAGEEGSPEAVYLDVRDFLDQGLRDTSVLDFRVRAAGNRPRLGAVGWHRDEAGLLELTEAPEGFDEEASQRDDEEVEGYAVIHRRGEFRVPVEILVEFADDTARRIIWDGQARYRVFTWPGQRVLRVIIDPDRKLALEVRRLDNARLATGTGDDGSRRDGLSGMTGRMTEGLSLATLGGLAP